MNEEIKNQKAQDMKTKFQKLLEANYTGDLLLSTNSVRNLGIYKENALYGTIFNDQKGRFRDGSEIATSNVLRFVASEDQVYAVTRFSIYKLLDVTPEQASEYFVDYKVELDDQHD